MPTLSQHELLATVLPAGDMLMTKVMNIPVSMVEGLTGPTPH